MPKDDEKNYKVIAENRRERWAATSQG